MTVKIIGENHYLEMKLQIITINQHLDKWDIDSVLDYNCMLGFAISLKQSLDAWNLPQKDIDDIFRDPYHYNRYRV